MRLNLLANSIVAALLAIACIPALPTMHAATGEASPADAAPDAALSSAIFPIVYPVDQSPSDRGYHYLFYGNGFFINEQGYLITAAHVLSQLHGGQPSILLNDSSGQPRFVRLELVLVDRSHDVALLRARVKTRW